MSNTSLNKTEVLERIREERDELTRRFSVRRIGLFGSVANDRNKPDSDVDILVELDEPTFDHYMDLKFFLEEAFEHSVDLVLADTVKPRIRPIIEREVIYV